MNNDKGSPYNSIVKEWESFLKKILPPWLELSLVKSWINGFIFLSIGFVGALIVGWLIFPALLYSEQAQPINFNHSLHMDHSMVTGIEGTTKYDKCLYCHTIYEDGSFQGIPTLSKCMECHRNPNVPFGNTRAEAYFLSEYVAKNKEIPWLSYYRQPDSVYFSHIAHIKNASINCTVCHGNHGELETLPVHKKNRINGYSINIWGKNITGWKSNTWDRMKMDDCVQCHTASNNNINNTCFVCHK